MPVGSMPEVASASAAPPDGSRSEPIESCVSPPASCSPASSVVLGPQKPGSGDAPPVAPSPLSETGNGSETAGEESEQAAVPPCGQMDSSVGSGMS